MDVLKTFNKKQQEALTDAVKEGSSDYLFYKWLEHSKTNMHRQLFDVWKDPHKIFSQGTDGQYGMRTLERTRTKFDEYVTLWRISMEAAQ